MPSFCIYPNVQKEWAVEMVMDLSQHLMKHGYRYTRTNPDYCIVIGGDGTLYHFLDELQGKVILIGSETTYMAQLSKDNWRERIIDLMENGKIVKLPVLEVKSDSHTIGYAMNDIAFHTNDHRVVHVNCTFDKQRMEFKGDGIIIATPFGSSAYSFSAGGKKLPLTSKSIAITPICPYLRSVSSRTTSGERIDVSISYNASLILDGKLALVSCKDRDYSIIRSKRTVEFLQWKKQRSSKKLSMR